MVFHPRRHRRADGAPGGGRQMPPVEAPVTRCRCRSISAADASGSASPARRGPSRRACADEIFREAMHGLDNRFCAGLGCSASRGASSSMLRPRQRFATRCSGIREMPSQRRRHPGPTDQHAGGRRRWGGVRVRRGCPPSRCRSEGRQPGARRRRAVLRHEVVVRPGSRRGTAARCAPSPAPGGRFIDDEASGSIVASPIGTESTEALRRGDAIGQSIRIRGITFE